MSVDFSAALRGTPDHDPFAAFDAATGTTHLPAAWYHALVDRGEMVQTKAGKPAYRLMLSVVDPPHAGFVLWRYATMDSPAAVNRAKALLAPLGLTSSAALREQFPAPGQVIRVRVLVGIQERADGSIGNDVLRLELVATETPAPNPNIVGTTTIAPPTETN